jgi:hypothetical protein
MRLPRIVAQLARDNLIADALLGCCDVLDSDAWMAELIGKSGIQDLRLKI